MQNVSTESINYIRRVRRNQLNFVSRCTQHY